MNVMEEDRKLFLDVQDEVTRNVRRLMEDLWLNWSHLGVDHNTKRERIKNLVNIEKDFHRDVLSETEQMMKSLHGEVLKLKAEADQLSQYLSLKISIPEFTEEDLLMEYKNQLEEHISGYRIQVEQRKTTIKRLLEWQRDLSDALGVTPKKLKEIPLPSEEELNELTNHLEHLQKERDERVVEFLNTQKDVKDIMEQLNIKPQLRFEITVVNSMSVDFKVNDYNMDKLKKLHQELQAKLNETKNRVLELHERLTRLWDCLEEDPMYRENFVRANPGCGPDTERAIREEITRCETIKKQKIQVFVSNVRTKIKLMWDACMMSAREREEFVHYYNDIFSEDTLTLHELYLDQLNKFYNEHKEIYEMVETRRDLWLKRSELEAKASEPGRFHNRGGQLLKEEKQRNAIESKLPKIEAQLMQLIQQYEEKNGKQFTVDGKPLMQMIEDEGSLRKIERQNKISARKQALTPNTNTPLFKTTMATSPLGKRNRTAAGLAGTADKNRLGAKRPMTAASASKVVSTINNNLSALKRGAITTIRRRMSGRLAARVEAEASKVVRKLNYPSPSKRTPRVAVNGSIIKNRSRSGRRRSGRLSQGSKTASSQGSNHGDTAHNNPVDSKQTAESTLLTSYTDFKEHIHDKQASRSSLAKPQNNVLSLAPVIAINEETPTKSKTPIKAPRVRTPGYTPKYGKENVQMNGINEVFTPKMLTPSNRLTRSTIKNNNDVFLTPRAPLSASKMTNFQRERTFTPVAIKTTPLITPRSKSNLNMLKMKSPAYV